MQERECLNCGSSFIPRPQVPRQAYCSAGRCQAARRLHWQREKTRTDPDYRENRMRCQRAWHERNPDYWRQYRQQRIATGAGQETNLGKALREVSPLLVGGVYKLQILRPAIGAKANAWVVEISPLSVG